MSPVRRVLCLLLLLTIGASSVEVVLGNATLVDRLAAQALSAGSADTPPGGALTTAPAEPAGETSDCACLCACVCAGAQSAIVAALVSVQFHIVEPELSEADVGRVHPLQGPRPPFRPPLA